MTCPRHSALSVLLPDQPATRDSLDAILLRATDGTVTDTLLRFRSGDLIVPDAGTVGFTLFVAEPVRDLADDARPIFGNATEYRLEVYTAGRLRRIIGKPQERRPVAAADIAAAISFRRRRGFRGRSPWRQGGLRPKADIGVRSGTSAGVALHSSAGPECSSP